MNDNSTQAGVNIVTTSRARVVFILILTALFAIAIQTPSPVYANSVIGTGTAASCTGAVSSGALQAAINAGGTITFNCGGAVTIPVTNTLNVDSMTGAKDVIIDGNGQVTLDGQGTTRIFFQRTYGFAPSAANSLTLQNISLINGRVSGAGTAANGAGIESINQSASNQQEGVPVLTIINVTFSNNVANVTGSGGGDYGGGAIYSGAGIVNVQNSTFTSNSAPNGGGAAIHILRSDLTVSGSTFTNNSAIGNGQGGAIYVDNYWTATHNLTISYSVFDGNTTWQGGGAIYINMYNNTHQFTVDRSTFRNNAVVGGNRAQGGAISGGSTTYGAGTGNAVATITNSTFSGNSVQQSNAPFDGSGGAISFNQKAVITIANSTFFGNIAHGTSYGSNGGAIAIGGNTTQFQIINSTIAYNHTGWIGGGIVSGSNGRFRNSIIANNVADNGGNGWNIGQQCSTALVNGGNNLQWPRRNTNPNYSNESTCFAGISSIADVSNAAYRDPMLDTVLSNNGGPTQTLALLTGSPAIDYGDNTVCAATPISNLDQRGQTRPTDGDGVNGPKCDTGAFEYVSTSPPHSPALLTPVNNAFPASNTVIFTWDFGGFATSYELQVDDDVNFGSPKFDIPGITGTNYTVPYLGVGTYHWRVISVNSFGTALSTSSTLNVVSLTDAAPPMNYYTSVPVILTWSAISGATHYQIVIADNPNFNGAPLPVTVDADTLSLSVSPPDGVYYWHVVAQAADGTWGTWSATQTFVVDR